uniref:Uncharacterized protein n=1 Tax=Glossina pallidipes TaxID=7398 RepID=A0A1A9ZW53_GLOPL
MQTIRLRLRSDSSSSSVSSLRDFFFNGGLWEPASDGLRAIPPALVAAADDAADDKDTGRGLRLISSIVVAPVAPVAEVSGRPLLRRWGEVSSTNSLVATLMGGGVACGISRERASFGSMRSSFREGWRNCDSVTVSGLPLGRRLGSCRERCERQPRRLGDGERLKSFVEACPGIRKLPLTELVRRDDEAEGVCAPIALNNKGSTKGPLSVGA